MINWLSKILLLMLRYQILVDNSLKHGRVDKQCLAKKIEDVDQKIPNSSGQVKKTD